jgi:hypothetical protein
MDQAAMAMAANRRHRGIGGEMPAVMGSQGRLGQTNGQKKGDPKAGKEAKPTR